MQKLKTNPDDPAFITAIEKLKQGDTIEVIDGTLIVEERFTEPTHFLFHQRIFDPGMILNKLDPKTNLITRVRIYVSGEQLGWIKDGTHMEDYDDRQIKDDGTILQPER